MAKRTFELLQNCAASHPQKAAISATINGLDRSFTYREWYDSSVKLSGALLKLGLIKGDRILVVTYNRPEWFILDHATAQIGVIAVTIFPNYSLDDTAYIFKEIDPEFIFVADKLLLHMIRPALDRINGLKTIISFEPIDQCLLFNDLLQGKVEDHTIRSVLEISNMVTPGDVYAIFYTSGTGGRPRGVALTHGRIVLAGNAVRRSLDMKTDDVAISFLSIAHTYERGHYLACLWAVSTIRIARRLTTPIANIHELSPTVLVTVPLMLIKLYEFILGKFKIAPDHPGLKLAMNYEIGDELLPEYQQFHESDFKEWRSAISDSIRVVASSGAILPEYICRFFWAINLPVQEVYGSSECFCITYSIPPDGVEFGTVGRLLEGVNVKIADDGEILCKSPYMMLGIVERAGINKHQFDENGYYHTGDLGQWSEKGFLKIIGRKKDNIKLLSGYFVTPSNIESELNSSTAISQTIVYSVEGILHAIIQPNRDFLCDHLQVDDLRKVSASESERMDEYIGSEIDRVYNNKKKSIEKIESFKIDLNLWSTATGELTPTMKPKRAVLINRVRIGKTNL